MFGRRIKQLDVSRELRQFCIHTPVQKIVTNGYTFSQDFGKVFMFFAEFSMF